MAAYLMAIEGVDLDAVERAAFAYMTGKIKGHDNRFAPSCAEFADACRYQQAAIEAERRPRIENKAKEDNSPRVAPWKVRLLKEALQGKFESMEELRRLYPHLFAETPARELEGKQP